MLKNKIEAILKEKFVDKEIEQFKVKTVYDLDINSVPKMKFYYISENGNIRESYFDSKYHEEIRNSGNAFLTSDEAKFYLERRKIEGIMRKYSNLYVRGERNYIIEYDLQDFRLITIHYTSYIPNGYYCFESEEIARKVIDEVGEENLIKYWFMVKPIRD